MQITQRPTPKDQRPPPPQPHLFINQLKKSKYYNSRFVKILIFATHSDIKISMQNMAPEERSCDLSEAKPC
jgi:hypothetical protein